MVQRVDQRDGERGDWPLARGSPLRCAFLKYPKQQCSFRTSGSAYP